MISIGLRVFRTADKLNIRNLRSRGRVREIGPNPGLNQRVTAFKKDGVQIDAEDAEEFIEESNSDMFQASESYQAHLKESFIGQHVLPKQIVKNKYFKENMPNLLTWSEKEQIRHLATVHPDEWTPERIAESFPVTVAVVKKLLKYPWKPASEQRIARHDASAMRNWRELKEGTLPIPSNLRNHFMKFSERTIPPLQTKSINMDVTPKQDIGEFQSIVDKCATKDKGSEEEESVPKEINSEEANKYKRQDKNFVTLDELTNKIKSRLDSGNNVDLPDKLLVSTVKSTETVKTGLNYQVELEDHKNTAVIQTHKAEEVVLKPYPERIRIPKKAYKRGATYKVNDCFYDDDGRLLYRVIGMTSK